jgi:hypothetical protein
MAVAFTAIRMPLTQVAAEQEERKVMRNITGIALVLLATVSAADSIVAATLSPDVGPPLQPCFGTTIAMLSAAGWAFLRKPAR